MKLNELKEFIAKYSNGGDFTYKQMNYSATRIEPEILFEGKYKDYQFYILNLGTHPTAYIEIPKNHKLFGKNYDEIYDMEIDIDVHGGLTYSSSTLICVKDKSWFIGWDYAHYGDYGGFDAMFVDEEHFKKWSTEEIFEDVINAIEQLIKEERK